MSAHVLAAACLAFAAFFGVSALTQANAEQPESAPAEWTPEIFDYTRPARIEMTDTTAEMKTRMTGLRQQRLVFQSVDGERVPVLMTMPRAGPGPFPLVLLVHGFESNKEGVSRQLARVLADCQMACLAIDLPFHGERSGSPKEMFPPDKLDEAYRHAVQAVKELRQAIDLAETRRELDTSHGIGLIGYSMGAWIGTLAGVADRRVNAMVLMVPGSAVVTAGRREAEGPGVPERLDLVHAYPMLRHNTALPRFSPRPVLLQNGKKDILVPSERAMALYEAAGAPKESRWYDSGHLLPRLAYEQAAEWIMKKTVKK